MRFAIIGLSPAALELVRSGLAQGHELEAAYDVGEHAALLKSLAPAARLNEAWESILVGDRAGLVLVAGPAPGTPWSDFEQERLRKLVQEAVPLVLLRPLLEVNLAYELEMIRRERSGVILTQHSDWRRPALRALIDLAAEDVAEGEPADLGPVEQVIFERRLADRSRPSVLAQFVQDAALLRRLLGTIKTVSATGGPAGEYRDPMAGGPKPVLPLSAVTVHLTGAASYAARWSIAPPAEDLEATLTLVAARGQAKLQLRGATGTDEFTLDRAGNSRPLAWPALDATEQFWVTAESALAGPITRFCPAWIDVCHDLEAAEAIDRSLLRGRTVAVTTDEPSEEESFKGIMAAGGCLTLVLSLGLFLAAGLVESLKLPIRNLAIWRLAPLLPLLPIGAFLVLQLLRLVVPKKVEG